MRTPKTSDRRADRAVVKQALEELRTTRGKVSPATASILKLVDVGEASSTGDGSQSSS